VSVDQDAVAPSGRAAPAGRQTTRVLDRQVAAVGQALPARPGMPPQVNVYRSPSGETSKWVARGHRSSVEGMQAGQPFKQGKDECPGGRRRGAGSRVSGSNSSRYTRRCVLGARCFQVGFFALAASRQRQRTCGEKRAPRNPSVSRDGLQFVSDPDSLNSGMSSTFGVIPVTYGFCR
jgi:hypothetical protein